MNIANYLIIRKKLLDVFLDGKFNILITGERGSGKNSILRQSLDGKSDFETIDSNYSYTNIEFRDALQKAFAKNENKKIVIDNIENLTFEQQVILNKYIQRTENLKLKEFKTRQSDIQFIFLSNFPVSKLYKLPHDYYQVLVDCIAQQVVRIPACRDVEKLDLIQAFELILSRMPDAQKLPALDDDFKNWLFSLSLPGNFRDLEMLAIHYYRYFQFSDELKNSLKMSNVLSFCKENYDYQDSPLEAPYFEFDKTGDEIIKKFKKDLAAWAEKVYPDTRTVLDKLKISEKTLYNWKNSSE